MDVSQNSFPPEYKAYRLAKRWRVFLYVLAPPMVLLFVGMPVMWWSEKPALPALVAAYCLLPLGLAGVFVYGLLDAIRGRVIVSKHQLTQVGLWGERQLAWVEIKGYRLDKNYLRLVPTDSRKRPINISLLTGQLEEIIDW